MFIPNRLTAIKIYLLLGLCLLLNACCWVRLAPHRLPLAPIHYTPPRSGADLRYWQAEGSISMVMPGHHLIGHFSWIESPTGYQIRLSGPLGLQTLQLTGKPGQVRLVTGTAPPITGTSFTQLMQHHWGSRLPITEMAYWIRGLAAPHTPYQAIYNNQQQITSLSQAGWSITLLHYQLTTHHILLPHTLYITQPPLSAKLVIRQWHEIAPPITKKT